jgi:hypothetical protein
MILEWDRLPNFLQRYNEENAVDKLSRLANPYQPAIIGMSKLAPEGGIEECYKCIIMDIQIILCQRQKRRPSNAIDVRRVLIQKAK